MTEEIREPAQESFNIDSAAPQSSNGDELEVSSSRDDKVASSSDKNAELYQPTAEELRLLNDPSWTPPPVAPRSKKYTSHYRALVLVVNQQIDMNRRSILIATAGQGLDRLSAQPGTGNNHLGSELGKAGLGLPRIGPGEYGLPRTRIGTQYLLANGFDVPDKV